MYDSGITVNDLIDILNMESLMSSDYAPVWTRAVSTYEQMMYQSYIGFYRETVLDVSDNGEYPISSLVGGTGEDSVRFDDIVRVFADGRELTRCGVLSGGQFEGDKEMYIAYDGVLKVYLQQGAEGIRVIWRIRPKIKTSPSEHIMLPYEWLDLFLDAMRCYCLRLRNDKERLALWERSYASNLALFEKWCKERPKCLGE